MREMSGRKSRVSIKLKAAIGALLAIFVVGAIGATSAQAASTPGNPVNTTFDNVGISVTALGNPFNQIILDPTTEDSEHNLLGTLQMNGTYDDAAGNFTVPKVGGLVFPPLSVEIEGAAIEATIGLTEASKGNYDENTGAMTFNPQISLVLGTDHLENIDGLPISGTGPLKCEFAPLDVNLSTNPVNWPAPGQNFTDPVNRTDGALAGAWTTQPKVKSLVESNKSLCPLIGALLEPVGGLYLANDNGGVINPMPAATAGKPAATPCPDGTTGTPGTPADECKVIPPPECEDGTTGTYPNCVPDVVKSPYAVSKVKISPKKGKIKAGKKVKLKIKVTNSGETDGSSKVTIKSSNKKVKAPKSVKINVAAGATVTKTIKLKVSKKAKGKAKITAKADGKSGKAKFTVKKAKKKKKKK